MINGFCGNRIAIWLLVFLTDCTSQPSKVQDLSEVQSSSESVPVVTEALASIAAVETRETDFYINCYSGASLTGNRSSR